MSESTEIKVVSSLDWPDKDVPLTTKKIVCAGGAYLSHRLRSKGLLPFLPPHLRTQTNGDSATKTTNDAEKKNDKKSVDLLKFDKEKLEKVSFYDVLDIPMHATPDSLRKAYHKACLKYHPDKTGRGEEDYVFLKIKEAFDTLSDTTKRRSYDSSVDFDDSIPKEGVSAKKFYKTYGPVFERNLRFAVHKTVGENGASGGGGGSSSNGHSNGGGENKKGKKKRKNNKNNSNNNNNVNKPKKVEPPKLGDENTPMEEVNAFYDYWTHFESWRDFTLKATKETDHDVEAAECREEKRWMSKEIERKSKVMKKQEVARVALLVQRAMAADPRLKREKERLQTLKKQKEEEKRRSEEEAKKKREAEEERLRKEDEERQRKEKEEKANSKQIKEKQKKALRKAKQAFRKLTIALFQEHQDDSSVEGCWTSLDEMNDEVELLCSHLTLEEIVSLNELLDGGGGSNNNNDASAVVGRIRDTVVETNESLSAEKQIKIKKRDETRAADARKRKDERTANSSKPWSKEELSALAKGVKKYPPGGANRWETIASFVNNLLKHKNPRTKDECIEAYNRLASKQQQQPQPQSQSGDASSPAATTSNGGGSSWSEDEDRQLQAGLAKWPSSMDKNERWTNIAKGVTGKTKKECVERFKQIRDALKK